EINRSSGPLVALQFLPVGKNLLTQRASRTPFGPGSQDQKIESVQKWDAATGKTLGTVSSSYRTFAVSPNGKVVGFNFVLAEGGKTPVFKSVKMMDVASGKEIAPLQTPVPFTGGEVMTMCFSPDAKTLAIRRPSEGIIELYEFPAGRLRQTLGIVKKQ